MGQGLSLDPINRRDSFEKKNNKYRSYYHNPIVNYNWLQDSVH